MATETARNPFEKRWGNRVFKGLDYSWDPQWTLNENQKTLQETLMELCRTVIRPNAIDMDEGRETYPHKSLKALQTLGLMGLIVPKELGGMEESHQCAGMVVETIARYGCPSTAMVYVMHLGAVATLCYRYHASETIKNLLRKVATQSEPFIGTLSFSDPSTGGHFWFPFSSKVQESPEGKYQFIKYGSWATSAGFADWYTFQALSPNYDGDPSNLTCYLVLRDEVRANTSDWKAIGMRGNQSGPLVGEALLGKERLIGRIGEGALMNDEITDIFFLLLSSFCWIGISLATVDIGKKHVVGKEHADNSMRVADYPTIQDYFGESVSTIASVRMFGWSMCHQLDQLTDGGKWEKYADPLFNPRQSLIHWLYMFKYEAAKVCGTVPETMLHACGGTGFKSQLGLERLLRDSKAAWVMGPSNEVLRSFVGKGSLFGNDKLDFWFQSPTADGRILTGELRKLNYQQKKDLAEQLLNDIKIEDSKVKNPSENTPEDFWNPLVPPKIWPKEKHQSILVDRQLIAIEVEEYTFEMAEKGKDLPGKCGEYLEVDLSGALGQECIRYLSPVSECPSNRFTVTIKLETGLMSTGFRNLKMGDAIAVRSPCGGYQHTANTVETLLFLCSGIGITPAVQIIRTIAKDPNDKTKVDMLSHGDKPDELLYHSELTALEKSDPRFSFHFAVSDPDVEWDGEEGFIDLVKIEKYFKHYPKKSPKGDNFRVIVCGGPSMIVASLYGLKQIGVDSENIYIYGPFGGEFLRTIYGRNAVQIKSF